MTKTIGGGSEVSVPPVSKKRRPFKHGSSRGTVREAIEAIIKVEVEFTYHDLEIAIPELHKSTIRKRVTELILLKEVTCVYLGRGGNSGSKEISESRFRRVVAASDEVAK